MTQWWMENWLGGTRSKIELVRVFTGSEYEVRFRDGSQARVPVEMITRTPDRSLAVITGFGAN
jgi:uncharacterized protein YndB with AHSA1/START domain